MDFFKIKERTTKSGTLEIYPDFQVGRTTDLMVRGKGFYAIWDSEAEIWSTDEYDVQRLVDAELDAHAKTVRERFQGSVAVKYMADFETQTWRQFKNYIGLIADNSKQLDSSVTFKDTKVVKGDYISKRLPYSLGEGDCSSYERIVSTLYSRENRDKIEWIIGAIISGESKRVQKFAVFYGPAGAGKSTMINLIESLFEGYCATFEADVLTGGSNAFAMDSFKTNPLVAIQHDGDLSGIKDNTKLNSIVSHEIMTINEKFKSPYDMRISSFLILGTNKPVKITDAKSGLVRRLIDIQPTGDKIPVEEYHALMSKMTNFELGAIAYRCLRRFHELGSEYYSDYKPIEMMLQTDHFYNFVEYYYDVFVEENGITQSHAWKLYLDYTSEYQIQYPYNGMRFRDELRNYFKTFDAFAIVDGKRVSSYYSDFDTTKFFSDRTSKKTKPSLDLKDSASILDDLLAESPAQYANEHGVPSSRWMYSSTKLKDLDTSKVHYVKPGLNHIVIDFDIKDDDGQKSSKLNLEAAAKWPETYAEFSKSGSGIHLHYIYDGDPMELSRVYDTDIEIKVFSGDASLRRRLSKCNNLPVATINSGLPLREKKVLTENKVMSEKSLRDLILRNLNKEIHNATAPSVSFIGKILEDAYADGLEYDVTDMQPRILAFANGSTNQALTCLKMVKRMKFKSEDKLDSASLDVAPGRIAFFDTEVYPNLFLLNWKYKGDSQMVRMINPSPSEVESLLKLKLIGFNCRQYDNHILYGRILGYDNEQLYQLSKRIVDNVPNSLFGAAYELSYADVYDYLSEKKGLKKWQIELGMDHKEMNLPWDEPVPEELWPDVSEYCDNDVISTEILHEARIQDFNARLILADLSGLSVNTPTNSHSAQIIFDGNQRKIDKAREFVYTDLATGERSDGKTDPVHFPGYVFDSGQSSYRGDDPSEGGYVYAEPGTYKNVALLDVASMHPSSAINLDLFGKYTDRFAEILRARLAIKHGDIESASKMMNGAFVNYLGSSKELKALSDALKIVINSVYGLTSARFDNPFRDFRNKDNIVAKRGALFMIDLKNFVQEKGYTVAHIKTDSIKIPDADDTIIREVFEFGAKYGYDFEHEATYDDFVLTNDAVYVAREGDRWYAVGAQFQHPFVYKTLFSNEPITFSDLKETKSVTTALYIDYGAEDDTPMALRAVDGGDNPRFVGRVGSFIPVTSGGGHLYRKKDDTYSYAAGSKGYSWDESHVVQHKIGDQPVTKSALIDWSYYDGLVYKAKAKLKEFGYENPEWIK